MFHTNIDLWLLVDWIDFDDDKDETTRGLNRYGLMQQLINDCWEIDIRVYNGRSQQKFPDNAMMYTMEKNMPIKPSMVAWVKLLDEFSKLIVEKLGKADSIMPFVKFNKQNQATHMGSKKKTTLAYSLALYYRNLPRSSQNICIKATTKPQPHSLRLPLHQILLTSFWAPS